MFILRNTSPYCHRKIHVGVIRWLKGATDHFSYKTLKSSSRMKRSVGDDFSMSQQLLRRLGMHKRANDVTQSDKRQLFVCLAITRHCQPLPMTPALRLPVAALACVTVATRTWRWCGDVSGGKTAAAQLLMMTGRRFTASGQWWRWRTVDVTPTGRRSERPFTAVCRVQLNIVSTNTTVTDDWQCGNTSHFFISSVKSNQF